METKSIRGIRQRFIILFAGSLFLLLSFSIKAQTQTLPRPDHIVILIEENEPNSWIVGSSSTLGNPQSYAPNINALAADSNSAVFTNMVAETHPSQPNYLYLFSGDNQGVTTDDAPTNYPFTTPNMARQLLNAGLSFKTYSQDLPSVGSQVVTSTSGSYARKHNPVANWAGTGTNQVSDTLNQPYSSMPTNFNDFPTVSYIVPDEDSDMHNGTGLPPIEAGDDWFCEHLECYNQASFMQWVNTHNTLFIFTYDEDNGDYNNNIPTIFYGPMVQKGTYTQSVTLCSILKMIEDMYGLSEISCASSASPINFCWKTVVSTPVGASSIATDISCYGQNSGSASVTPSGGNGTYTYLWSNNATTASISNVPAGTYTVTVTSNGQTATSSVTVNQPANGVSASTSVTPTSCSYNTNGSVTVSASGGTPGYSYSWSNNGAGATISGVGAGTYTVTITDNNSCTATVAATVTAPTAINASASSTQTSCSGATGSASVTVTGGTPGYSYSWNNSGTGASISSLNVGNYTVTITDNNGCTATAVTSVNAPAAYSLSVTGTNETCYGQSTANVAATVSGTTGNVTYLWNNSATAQAIGGLAAGTYEVTVEDASGCAKVGTITVTQPQAINIVVTSTPSTGNNGTLTAAVTGGTPPYQYAWSNSETDSTSTALAPGNYSVTITDANSCTATALATVAVNTTAITPVADIAWSVNIFPNPANDNINVQIDGSNGNFEMRILDISGKYVYASTETGNGKVGRRISLSGLASGVYILEITMGEQAVRKRFIVSH